MCKLVTSSWTKLPYLIGLHMYILSVSKSKEWILLKSLIRCIQYFNIIYDCDVMNSNKAYKK